MAWTQCFKWKHLKWFAPIKTLHTSKPDRYGQNSASNTSYPDRLHTSPASELWLSCLWIKALHGKTFFFYGTLLDSFHKPLQSCCMWLAVAVQIHNATNALMKKRTICWRNCEIHLLKRISLYMSYFSDIFAHKHGINVVLSGIGPHCIFQRVGSDRSVRSCVE